MVGVRLCVFLVSVLILAIPGCLVLRLLRLPMTECLALSAPVSVLFYVGLGVLLDAMSLRGVAPFAMLASVLCVVLAAACFFHESSSCALLRGFVMRWWCRRKGADWRLCLISVVVGVAVMLVLFVIPLDGPDSFLQVGDNATHLNTVAAMVAGGSFSTFSADQYGAVTDTVQSPFVLSGAFYPSGWHIVVALTSFFASVEVTLAENAANYAFVAVVYSAGFSVLIQRVFKGNSVLCAFSSFTAFTCAAFPLRALVVHQIYPNIAGMCCIPAIIVLALFSLGGMKARAGGCAFVRCVCACLAWRSIPSSEYRVRRGHGGGLVYRRCVCS